MVKAIRGLLLSVMVVSPFLNAAELTIRVVDKQSKSLVSARVELLSESGDPLTADNAVSLSRECVFAPMPGWLRQEPPKTIENPFSGTTQHYLSGVGHYSDLEAGEYTLRVFRGPEYRIAEMSIRLNEQEPNDVHVILERWHNASESGWYGADDHLHLARSDPAGNESLGHWMSAEGLHIANFLQMGTLTQFGAAPQYAFGEAGAAMSSGVLLLSGQEHPRTHIFGHEITLGATAAIDERLDYTLYDSTFLKGRKLEGISGFAHWGIGAAGYGLAVSVPKGNVEFLEVLNFEFPWYETWYQLLNLGFPIAATAGTDFPCLASMPGRERFYTKIEGEPTRASFVAGIRKLRTFVTNGPMLSLAIDGADIGSRKTLLKAKTVSVNAEVFSDPSQDRISHIELIQNGRVIADWLPNGVTPYKIRLDVLVDRPSWFALRASGEKVGEALPSQETNPLWIQAAYDNWISGAGGSELDEYLANRTVRESAAHTSPIYFDMAGRTDAAYHVPLNSRWLAKLDELELFLKGESYDEKLILDWLPYSDGVSAEHLQEKSEDILAAIYQARRVIENRLNLQ